MLKIFSREKTTPVDREIDAVLQEMQKIGVYHDDYPTMMKHLDQLYDLREKSKPKVVSRDTLLVVGGNLLGVLLIVASERSHVMMSKGLGQLIRPKL